MRLARFAVLCVGNELRGDDAAGPALARKLSGRMKALVIDGAEIPENTLPQLRAYRPDTVIIVDAAHFGKRPGYTAVIEEDDIANASFSTHRLPLSLLARHIKEEIPGAAVIIIGIQPGQTTFAAPLSPAVSAAVAHLARILSA